MTTRDDPKYAPERATDARSDPAQRWPSDNDFAHLLRIVWAGRWRVLSTAILCAAVMTVYAFSATPWYRAQVSLLAVEDKSAQALLTQLGGLSGLASLAGIEPATGNPEPVAVLRSRDFARSFIERENLLPILFDDKWDATAGKWKTSPRKTPDTRDAVEFFERSVRRMGEDRQTGLIILTVEWKDPVAAASWANGMARQINAQMRARAIQDAESRIAYLQSELQATNQVSLQQSISRLLESQMQNLMVARGNEEYAFRVIDTAYPPKKRFKPQRALLILGAGVIGALGASAVLVLLRSQRSPTSSLPPLQ